MKKHEKAPFDKELMDIHQKTLSYERLLARVRKDEVPLERAEGVRLETLMAMNQLFAMGD